MRTRDTEQFLPLYSESEIIASISVSVDFFASFSVCFLCTCLTAIWFDWFVYSLKLLQFEMTWNGAMRHHNWKVDLKTLTVLSDFLANNCYRNYFERGNSWIEKQTLSFSRNLINCCHHQSFVFVTLLIWLVYLC